MKYVWACVLFVLSVFLVMALGSYSQTPPECFIQTKDGRTQDLTRICGATPGKPSTPQTPSKPTTSPTPPKEPVANLYRTRNGKTVSLPATWKVNSDGSIAPSPNILVPELWDIDI
ncbi:MAG: hypothetical protein RMK91_12370 [Pseudanabaenaceae cyanobacterium SKYGB_i_bin29]|nr:hypothetical protein [Pseudanabaenaceae cyanobacterium SKYG29]MDW8422649.1 hypothetical protein [Pseudanabaenaceae cyanobacterium SKYGB_i_bin29]